MTIEKEQEIFLVVELTATGFKTTILILLFKTKKNILSKE